MASFFVSEKLYNCSGNNIQKLLLLIQRPIFALQAGKTQHLKQQKPFVFFSIPKHLYTESNQLDSKPDCRQTIPVSHLQNTGRG